MKKTILTSCIVLLTIVVSQAQDFERIAPKEIKVTPTKLSLPATGDISTLEQDETVIIPSLSGLFFHSNPESVSITATVDKSGLSVVNDSDIMRKNTFVMMMQGYIGNPVSMRTLSQLKRDIIIFYRDNDRPVVDVVLPEQDVTNGVIQLVVIESVLDRKRVTGNKYFSEKALLRQMTIKEKETISATTLLADMDWINKNPFLRVQPIFAPGKTPYTSDVILRVADHFPWRFYAGYENTGNGLTGEDRYLVGFNWGNAFGLGHQLNYQYLIAEDFNQLGAHSLSYRIPNANKSELELYGSFTSTEVEASPFSTEGESAELGLRYIKQLSPVSGFATSAYAGFAWKSSENALEFGSVPVSGQEVQLGQFELGYRVQRSGKGYSLNGDLGLVSGIGGIFSQSDDSAFDAVRAGADSNYNYLKLRLNYVKQLPNFMVFESKLRGQWSADRLLSSEQLSVGGFHSVRGYNERELGEVDNGFIWGNELKFKPITFCEDTPYQGQAQFLVFSDYAVATGHGGQITRADASSVNTAILWSAGLGVRLNLSDHLTIRADYGWQLRDAGSDDNGRFHFGMVMSF